MIIYLNSTETVNVDQLQGFFSDWPHQPSPESLLRILNGSNVIVLAFDTDHDRVVGYITAISDGVSGTLPTPTIPHFQVGLSLSPDDMLKPSRNSHMTSRLSLASL